MRPIEFKEQNTVFAKDQPEYLPLPAYRTTGGNVLSCWELTEDEKKKIVETGKLWIWTMTFNGPLQPLIPTVENPFEPKVVCLDPTAKFAVEAARG